MPNAIQQYSWTVERARVAGLSRDRSKDDPELIEAKRKLKYLRLHTAIIRVSETGPSLTREEQNILAGLILGGSNE